MKNLIEKRLESLRQQEQMLLANLNATKGAIATLESILKEHATPPEPQPATAAAPEARALKSA